MKTSRARLTMRKSYVHKNAEYDRALRLLRSFLDSNEPSLVRVLVNTWHSQGKAITYKELREAIVNGYIDENYLQDWMEDYSKFVTVYLRPKWVEAMETAAKEIERKHPDYYFDPYSWGVRDWCDERAASFVTEVSTTQIDGLRAVISRASVLEDMSVDQLAHAIRPMVGLTEPQAKANMRYYEKLIEKGTSEKRARDLSTRYAARQHRYRAYNIARTELSFSYNRGSYEGTLQAQQRGYMGDVVKVWCTADDERVCKICGGLEGVQVPMDQDFDFPTKLGAPGIRLVPPAHPSCRCAVLYEEVSPPPKNS